jgi:hypothetical protein
MNNDRLEVITSASRDDDDIGFVFGLRRDWTEGVSHAQRGYPKVKQSNDAS